jgi:hypothetical protein
MRWAYTSFALSALGWLTIAGYWAMGERYFIWANATGGALAIFALAHLAAAALLFLLGLLCGGVALARTRRGRRIGKVFAWLGFAIGLSSFVWMAASVWANSA